MEKLQFKQLYIFLTCLISLALGGYQQDRVLLSDINVLTLKHGYKTSARRSAPVPQLKCVGGTAGCNKFVPQVVQCYNRGSDGIDVQWECKTDMDNAYRFGEVEVTCEGYDYPEDMYVLKGSCGLEYKVDLTKEGSDQDRGYSNQYSNQYSSNHGNEHDYYGSKSKSKSGFGDIIMLGVVALIIYGIYKSCISTGNHTNPQDSTGYPNNQQGHSQGPPPPGFRSEYMPGSDHCSGSSYTTNGMGGLGGSGLGGSGLGGNRGGGGFWTGAAAGGLLGYLFGGRNTGYNNNGYGQRSWFGNTGYGNAGYGNTGSSWFGSGNRNTGSSWFGSGSGSSSGFSSGRSSSSSGTRSASGFGGTKRR